MPPFFLPLDIALCLLLWGVIRQRRRLQWAGILVLLLSSNPTLARYLTRTTEQWATRTPVADAAPADAIVVLSAGRVIAPGPARVSEWDDADRFFAGIELFRAGKAPLLVFTGGWVPWDSASPLEGELLAEQARAFGIAADRVLVTGRVSNTAEEAEAVRQLMARRGASQSRVLLVTSAVHMPRADELFARAGFAVVPFPVDFAMSEGGRLPGAGLLPSIAALKATQTALRELYGRAYYSLKGAF